MSADLFVAVLLVVGFHRLFGVASRVDYMRPCHMGMVRRFLVMSALVVLRCFTVVARSVGGMLLCLLGVQRLFSTFLFSPDFVIDEGQSLRWRRGQ